jgi:hypothetical protein
MNKVIYLSIIFAALVYQTFSPSIVVNAIQKEEALISSVEESYYELFEGKSETRFIKISKEVYDYNFEVEKNKKKEGHIYFDADTTDLSVFINKNDISTKNEVDCTKHSCEGSYASVVYEKPLNQGPVSVNLHPSKKSTDTKLYYKYESGPFHISDSDMSFSEPGQYYIAVDDVYGTCIKSFVIIEPEVEILSTSSQAQGSGLYSYIRTLSTMNYNASTNDISYYVTVYWDSMPYNRSGDILNITWSAHQMYFDVADQVYVTQEKYYYREDFWTTYFDVNFFLYSQNGVDEITYNYYNDAISTLSTNITTNPTSPSYIYGTRLTAPADSSDLMTGYYKYYTSAVFNLSVVGKVKGGYFENHSNILALGVTYIRNRFYSTMSFFTFASSVAGYTLSLFGYWASPYIGTFLFLVDIIAYPNDTLVSETIINSKLYITV